MHEQYSIAFVIKQKIRTIIKLIIHAVEKDIEKKAWERWLIDYQVRLLTGTEFISFDDYLAKIKKTKVNHKKIAEKDKEEIRRKARELKSKPYKIVREV